MFSAGQVFAEGGHDHGEHGEETSQESKGSTMGHKGSMMEGHNSELPNIGNKICPVSDELISEVDDGKGAQIEHNGKIYNVCCNMCAKDFKKDPEKFITIIKKELNEAVDAHEGEESSHGEKKGSHHEEGGHGDDDSKEGHERGGRDH